MRILVPLDCSAELDGIFPWVRMFLEPRETRLVFVHVSPADVHEPGRPAVWAKCQDECQPYMTEVAAKFKEWGDQIDLHVHIGSPSDEILVLAREQKSDLILMRTHALTRISRVLLGSVAAEVVARSDVPVMMLGPSAPKTESPRALRKILVPLDGSEWSAEILKDVRRLAGEFRCAVVLFYAVKASPGMNRPGIVRWAKELIDAGINCSARTGRGGPRHPARGGGGKLRLDRDDHAGAFGRRPAPRRERGRESASNHDAFCLGPLAGNSGAERGILIWPDSEKPRLIGRRR